MQYFLLTSFLLLIAISGHSQTVYFEDFDSPGANILALVDNDSLTNSSGSTETWQYSPRIRRFANGSMLASGNFCLRSITDPSPAVSGQQSEDWIQLPLITIPTNGLLMFKFEAESNVSQWEGYPNLEIRVSTTDSSLSSYSTIKTITACRSWFNNHSCDLSAYSGQTIYIAIVNTAFNNPGWGSKRIFIDDIYVGSLFNRDCEAFNYVVQDYAEIGTPKEIDIAILNKGADTVTSVNFNYQVNGGPVIVSTISGLNIPSLDSATLIHPTPWIPSAAGSQWVKMWIDSINGGADQDNSNDTLVDLYDVYARVTPKKPLLEIFGGSNCAACAPLAEDIDDFLDAWNFNAANGSISTIEYQTFPGDPSDNQDAQIRDTFYSVVGYPDEQITEASDYKDMLLDDRFQTYAPFFDYAKSPLSGFPAFVDINLSASYSGNTVSVDVTVDPLKDFPGSNLRLHIAICEKQYTYTGGGTSQSEFKHIMRKMLPDAYGTPIGPLTENNSVSINESYTFNIGSVVSGSFNLWTGMNNIEVVAFLQDSVTEEVFQSASLSVQDITGLPEDMGSAMKVYPNPTSGHVHVELETGNMERLELISISGQTVMKIGNLSSPKLVDLDLTSLRAGIYFLHITSTEGTPILQKIILN